MSLLEKINSPFDLRRLRLDELQDVAEEIRQYILETMSRVGGHTGASLGAVELAVEINCRRSSSTAASAVSFAAMNLSTTRSAPGTLLLRCRRRSVWRSRAIARRKTITSWRLSEMLPWLAAWR